MNPYDQPTGFALQPRSSVSWYTKPVTLVIIVVLVCGLLVGSRPEYRSAVMLAAFNFAVICYACVRLVKRRSLSSMVPVLFLAWVAVGWPLGTVVFGLIYPDMHYDIPAGRRYMLDGNFRLQLVALVFVVTYLATFWIARPRSAPNLPLRPSASEARRLMSVVVPICLFVTALLAIAAVMGHQSNVIFYVAFGLQKYIIGLYLVVGGCLLYLRMPTIIFILSFLALAGLIFIIGNARGLAAIPIVLTLAGLLFLSSLKGRTKSLTFLSMAIGGPILLVIGNTTRAFVGGSSFRHFSERLAALSEWREYLGESSVLLSTFGRLFSTGGHAIITSSPEQVPYMAFDLPKYLWEIASSLFVPGAIYLFAPYSLPTNLNNYGFHLIPGGHSVELSMIGSFWMIGGYVAVLLGGIALGLFHSALAHWIDRASRRSILKGAVYLSGVSMPLLWAQNQAFPSHMKITIWAAVFMGIIYHLILRPIAGGESAQHTVVVPPSHDAAYDYSYGIR